MKESGVDVVEREGAMAYAPQTGSPGQLIIDPNASITAILHEYQHYLDNMEMGFPGPSVLFNKEVRINMEKRAYLVEIEFMKDLGYSNVCDKLLENMEMEIQQILNRLGM